MDQPLSPLEPLDPHRLRDMVVDKQAAPPPSSTPHQMPPQWTQQQQQMGNTASPASIGSPHSMLNQRHSTSSGDVNSPFQQPRPPSQQQSAGSGGQSFDFNPPRTPMYPGGSPTKPMGQQPHMSPQQPPLSNHPPGVAVRAELVGRLEPERVPVALPAERAVAAPISR
ncbi:hypothetical protein M3Y99_01467800 [Aphelenchoides fujianensis]|nr:hypothetical protein M3Y99_01467800 [Aphelenchoides fujianensis]